MSREMHQREIRCYEGPGDLHCDHPESGAVDLRPPGHGKYAPTQTYRVSICCHCSKATYQPVLDRPGALRVTG